VLLIAGLVFLECKFYGNKRVFSSLDGYDKAHPELSNAQLSQVKEHLSSILAKPSLAAFSQRIRLSLARYPHQ
jgi:hypothetical protein